MPKVSAIEIVLLCDVIDNFGDAGVSLRLARSLCWNGCNVTLIHNNTSTFTPLLGTERISGLSMLEAKNLAQGIGSIPSKIDAIVQPFGSSAPSHNMTDLIEELKHLHPHTPWAIVDYLSAEDWVESFHLNESINPGSGHRTTYFYPGFTNQTGGLIHADLPVLTKKCEEPEYLDAEPKKLNTVFLFCYPHASIETLLASMIDSQRVRSPHTHWAQLNSKFELIPFCKQLEFDCLLQSHDFLFVRGEDSFVRAQLAGKPFVWQIYPTEDKAHLIKLEAFFEQYKQGLEPDLQSALWQLWLFWNGEPAQGAFEDHWKLISGSYPAFLEHAKQWKEKICSQKELVGEILTWLKQQALLS